jgi:hypothetical protein
VFKVKNTGRFDSTRETGADVRSISAGHFQYRVSIGVVLTPLTLVNTFITPSAAGSISSRKFTPTIYGEKFIYVGLYSD